MTSFRDLIKTRDVDGLLDISYGNVFFSQADIADFERFLEEETEFARETNNFLFTIDIRKNERLLPKQGCFLRHINIPQSKS